MKNVMLVSCLMISLLTGLVFAANVDAGLGVQIKAGENASMQVQSNAQGEISEYQAKVVVREQNQLKVHATAGNCPSDCECDGSTTKCNLGEGREMTIRAGNSNNTIIQMKRVNASTNVSLYKTEGKYYGTFGNTTKQINYLPDEVGERLRQRLNLSEGNCTMNLDENGTYQVQTQQQVKILGLFKAQQQIKANVNAFNGEISDISKPWWSFLITSTDEE